MGGLDSWLDKLPSWAGTAPQWGMFIVLAIAMVRTSPAWVQAWSAWKIAASNRNRSRIRELEQQVHDCHKECETKIAVLTMELHSMRAQRNAEQLSIMRAIVRMSGDPAVKQQLDLLEAIEIQAAEKGA